MRHALLSIALLIALSPHAHSANADTIFNDYIQAILAEDWPKAESFWLAEEVALAKRLGVEFTGVPLKVDCSSPVLEHRLALRDNRIQMAVSDSALADTLIQKTVTLRSASQTSVIVHRYLVVQSPDGWRLTSPIYHATRSWPVITTMHVRLRCPSGTLTNQFALDALDRFIDSLGTIFHFRPEHWVTLNDNKLDYYLADRETIRNLTGYDAHGMTYLPLDAVVTSHLPHDHELVHAILNFRMNPLPMYTLPAVQEGVAVSYGGRWGKSPRVIMQLGAFVLEADMMNVDDILTYDGFHADAADLSYALSGLLTRCLIESMGFPRFSVLYRRLSGPQQYVRSLTNREVKRAIEESTGQPWDSFIPGCVGREVETFSHRGIDPCDAVPSVRAVWEKSVDGFDLQLFEDETHYYIEARGANAGKTVALCAMDAATFAASTYRSHIFSDQFPGEVYRGEYLGIVFDSLEAGVYDYRTDLLLAKFASGFTAGEMIWNPVDRIVRFKVDKFVLPVGLRIGNLSLVW